MMAIEEMINILEEVKELDEFFQYNPKYLKELNMIIRSLKQKPDWIPVSEDLPKEDETVIASTKYGVYPETRYTKEEGWQWAYESGADYWVKLEDVEAWMPLPESYKGRK